MRRFLAFDAITAATRTAVTAIVSGMMFCTLPFTHGLREGLKICSLNPLKRSILNSFGSPLQAVLQRGKYMPIYVTDTNVNYHIARLSPQFRQLNANPVLEDMKFLSAAYFYSVLKSNMILTASYVDDYLKDTQINPKNKAIYVETTTAFVIFIRKPSDSKNSPVNLDRYTMKRLLIAFYNPNEREQKLFDLGSQETCTDLLKKLEERRTRDKRGKKNLFFYDITFHKIIAVESLSLEVNEINDQKYVKLQVEIEKELVLFSIISYDVAETTELEEGPKFQFVQALVKLGARKREILMSMMDALSERDHKTSLASGEISFPNYIKVVKHLCENDKDSALYQKNIFVVDPDSKVVQAEQKKIRLVGQPIRAGEPDILMKIEKNGTVNFEDYQVSRPEISQLIENNFLVQKLHRSSIILH